MRRLKKVWELLLEAFFPQVCLNCQKYLGEEEKNNLVCSACLAGVEIYHNLFYPSSGITLAAASSYANPVVRELIHSLKYRGFLRAVQPLGTILATYLERLNFNLQDFVIVPVPLHPTRFRQRGFNQAELLAQAVGNYFNLPVLNSILKRIKATIPQIELTDNRERLKNLKGSFAVQKKHLPVIRERKILLVDDVYTSGATIKEAVKTLRQAGAKEIIALVVAKAG